MTPSPRLGRAVPPPEPLVADTAIGLAARRHGWMAAMEEAIDAEGALGVIGQMADGSYRVFEPTVPSLFECSEKATVAWLLLG